jgi:hypothetical protein
MMNRWILRGLVTAGIAGAAWALSSTAASADTNTTVDAHVGIGLPVTSNGITAELGVDIVVGRPAERPGRPPVAVVVVRAVVAPVSTSDGAAPATVDAAVSVGRSTSDGDAAAEVAVLAEPAPAAELRAAVVFGPTGTEEDAGSVAGSEDNGPETSGGGTGPEALPATNLGSAGVVVTATADRATAAKEATGGTALASTGTPAVGLVLLALLMMLVGAASYRVGARR